MGELCLEPNENCGYSAKEIPVEENKKYSISTEVVGFLGEAYSGYFGIVLFDFAKKSLGRRIRWLNDFSGVKKHQTIIFQTPKGCKSIKPIYRINIETPIKSKCRYQIQELNELKIREEDSSKKEDYELSSHYVLPKLEELSQEKETLLEKNLVWIFASPRSGTSWLGLQLLSYQTYAMNEPRIGKHLGLLDPMITKVITDLDRFKFDPNYFFSQRYEKTWKYYLRKLILNRIYSQFHDLSKNIIIKEPNGSQAADTISEILPDSKIIILFRDGRDVIDSMLDARQPDAWTVTTYDATPITLTTRLENIERDSKVWVYRIEKLMKIYSNRKEQPRLLVRYEDLRYNTLSELKKIYDFLEINIPNEDLKKIVDKFTYENIAHESKGKGKPVRFASPGHWQNLSDKEKGIMQKIMGKTLQKLGYGV